MFERYTTQARRAVFYARFETSLQSATTISIAHLLIGLTRESGSRADAIASLKENASQLRLLLGMPESAKTPDRSKFKQDLKLETNSKMALAYAAKESEADGAHDIDTDHLLRGILSFPNEAATALNSLHLDLATARLASRGHRADFPKPRTRLFGNLGRPVWLGAKSVVKMIVVVVIVEVLLHLLLGVIRWFS